MLSDESKLTAVYILFLESKYEYKDILGVFESMDTALRYSDHYKNKNVLLSDQELSIENWPLIPYNGQIIKIKKVDVEELVTFEPIVC